MPQAPLSFIPSPHRIFAVVVTYNIGARYLVNFEAIQQQVEKVILVDNGSSAETAELLRAIARSHPETVHFIPNTENLGLAKAQNQGIRYAMDEGAEFVLLLDHDSKAAPDMILKMLAAYESYPHPEHLALIAPRLRDINIAAPHAYIVALWKWFVRGEYLADRPYTDDVLAVFASGSMIKTSIFKEVGLMREDFFIDYIDNEFCLRLHTRGYRIMAVKDAKLEHELGQIRVVRIGKYKLVTTNHSPSRRYTIFRNRLELWHMYWRQVPSFILYDMYAALYHIVCMLLFETNRWQKLCAISRGVRDAFLRRRIL